MNTSPISSQISWSLVVAANSEKVLQGNLLGTGEVESATDVCVIWGARSSSSAYNYGLARTRGEVVVFAHQDVFLPKGWALRLNQCLKELTANDPQWGVAGIFGVSASGEGIGYTYSTGLGRYVGKPFRAPTPVRTLDEIILIIRRSSGLFFDEKLPGFHLYGADICLEAESRGMRNYAIPCFALHNSCGVKWLPPDFWRAYMYLRRKWWDRLPIITSCTKITKSCAPMFHHFLERSWITIKGKNKPGVRLEDPTRFYEEHIKPTAGRS